MLKTFTQPLRQTAISLWSFIKQPADAPADVKSSGKFKVLLWVLIIDILVSTILVVPIEAVEWLGWYSADEHASYEMFNTFPMWGVLLLGVLVIPIMEEIIFRYGLRFRRSYFAALFAGLLVVCGGFAFYLLPLLWALVIVAVLFVLYVLYLLNAYAIGDYLEQIWPQKYRLVFYSVAVLFGLMHIANYTGFDYTSAAVLLIPVLIAPQIWAGFALGYMRVKYGFFWGLFLHVAHNAFFFSVALLFMSELKEKLNVSNDQYTLKVEEYMRPVATAGSQSTIDHDSVAFKNIKLEEVIIDLLQKEEDKIQFEESVYLKRNINLAFKSQVGDLAQNRKLVLAELQKLYKFDVTTVGVEQEMWDVALEDGSRLAPYQVEDKGESKVTVTPVDITLENATMEELLRTIKSEFYINLENKTQNEGKYNLKIAKNGFKQLREELLDKYGIVLQPRKIMAEQAVISFRSK
ncbi:CPBP family intramembrane glutamic endopeptidase [Pontibacter cellulosilyticus]|uniref:CPBP family intramembrane metalloprotease n=1 Tax=Pontibacter cellulosilyticus TaxID=1720253 RepID=A0A923SJH6_9BACT|nr:CPBP family intramembrane glutamic endopeptidase [Pontibacter cellulosilyticus]MBC5992741.1 CPBP family intramembrane metalloprotease [Pontibacter cellulosilyticus]